MDPLIDDLPDYFPVAVMMERRSLVANRWADHQWTAVAVTVDPDGLENSGTRRVVHRGDGTMRELHSGFEIRLHPDECESYYHNLVSPEPRCYVIASPDGSDIPIPGRVTLSFDEAHAYMEGEAELFVVEIAPELYRWVEAFVLAHYAPEKRRKRKRTNWSETGERRK